MELNDSEHKLFTVCLLFNQTEKRARQELEKWRQQIQELQDRCQAALHVMEEFRGKFSKHMRNENEPSSVRILNIQELKDICRATLLVIEEFKGKYSNQASTTSPSRENVNENKSNSERILNVQE